MPVLQSVRSIYKVIGCHILINRSRNESLRLKNDKANGSIAFIGLLWSINTLHLLQNDCLKPLTLSAVGNDNRMLRNKFVVVCKCSGAGTLLTVKCPFPGTHRETNARGFARGGCSRLELTRT